MPPAQFIGTWRFAADLLLTLVAVVFCFLIFFRTKESYELTKYRGINLFRYAFLFFGLSYLVRFIFGLFFLTRIAFDFFIPRLLFLPIFILVMGYFSTAGIFYLIFSSIFRKMRGKALVLFGHVIALLLSLISFLSRSHYILLYMQMALLLLAVFLIVLMPQSGRRLSNIRILYLLVAFLWLLNLLAVNSRPFAIGLQPVLELASVLVFVIIYFRILKWLR